MAGACTHGFLLAPRLRSSVASENYWRPRKAAVAAAMTSDVLTPLLRGAEVRWRRPLTADLRPRTSYRDIKSRSRKRPNPVIRAPRVETRHVTPPSMGAGLKAGQAGFGQALWRMTTSAATMPDQETK